ncbi:Uncharacterized protein FWK35_00020649 [Aphis craccivora]|uniref:Uncharacterized protein n=1 Tax=Aphis craccivora TaxID=307492 RepID=A0A6G0YBA3_APHCR|nr:Uncharacterized protein FWK35_00020649 [Aphis craccivora]
MTVEILNTAIEKLYSVRFTTVAFVSDMGSKNRSLHIQLNITPEKPYFETPHIPDGKVFDIRRHGRMISRASLDALVEIQTGQLKVGWKLSKALLNVKARAILFAGDKNLLKGKNGENNYKVTSYFIELNNAWFDVHNSINMYGSHSGLHAYGINLTEQNRILNEMSSIFKGLRVKKHISMLPFQYGILLSNTSLKQLLPYLKDRFSEVHYVLGRRLNQDILENLFSYLRSMGNTSDNPAPLDFMRRLKKYILGKHSAAIFSNHQNTKKDTDVNNLSMDILNKKKNNEEEIVITQDIFVAILDGKELIYEEEPIDLSNTDIFSSVTSMAGLQYIIGFVAHHFKNKYPELGQ